MQLAVCIEDGCDRIPHSRNLCSSHYYHHRMAGTLPPKLVDLNGTRVRVHRQKRLWAASECAEDGCGAAVVARNLCSLHYQRHTRDGTLPPKVRHAGVRFDLDEFACAVEGCVQTAQAKGLCRSHYSRSLRYGLGFKELAAVDMCDRCEACGESITDVKGDSAGKHLDHEHDTGDLRGVLCQSCNTALGLLSESVPRLVGLLNYLVKWQESTKA